MKVLCLTDFPIKAPDRWIWNYLPDNLDQVDFLTVKSRDTLPGLGKFITRYPAFVKLSHAAQRQTSEKKYDVIVAWESKIGFPLAFLRRLHRVTHPPLVILAFAAKPPFTTKLRILTKWLLCHTHIVVPSEWEQTWYVDQLGIIRTDVEVCPLAAYDATGTIPTSHQTSTYNPDNIYIFSGGRSERDYKTLLDAVTGLNIRTVINTRRYILKDITSSWIEVNDIMPPDYYRAMLAGAFLVALPLRKVQHAIGLSVVLDSMAASKPLICSDIPALRDYVVHGVTGLLVPPEDAGAMRDAIGYMLKHPEEAKAMGRAARRRFEERHTFDVFAHNTYKILRRVHQQTQQAG